MDNRKQQRQNEQTATDELFDAGTYGSLPLLILERADLTPAAKLVWLALGTHRRANHTAVWPSAMRLARMTALSRDTVLTAVAALEGKGLVEVDRTFGRSSVYHLKQPKATAAPNTSRKNPPVGKTHRSEKPTTPVGISDRTSRNFRHEVLKEVLKEVSPPSPPAKKRGGRVRDSLAASKGKRSPEEIVTAFIGGAYREAVGIDMPSTWQRRIRREWNNGSAWMLDLIDAAAIRSGLAMATRNNRTFGLGWVVKAVEAKAAQKTAMELAARASSETSARAKAIATDATRAVAAAAGKNAAALEAFDAMEPQSQEAYLEAAAKKCRFVTREPTRTTVIRQTAALLAWNERQEKP